MTEVVVGVRLSQEDADFLDEMATTNMSYRGTIARRLLSDRIQELRAALAVMANREESTK